MPLALPLQFLLVTLAGWINRSQQDVIDYLLVEVAVYRELLAKQGGMRLTDEQRLRLAEKGKVLGRAVLANIASIAMPDTILGWIRRIAAKKYDGSRPRGGKSRTNDAVVRTVLRMSRDCRRVGYTRLQGMLENVRFLVSRSTVARILKANGELPAPERGRKSTWREFLKAELDMLMAADFFTVEVLTWVGMVRYLVFFVMEVKTRRVHIAGITSDAHGKWMEQIARNLTDPIDGFLKGKWKLILDRDPLNTKAFRDILENAGVQVLRLPPRSPNLNPHAERFVRSIRSECLSRIVPLGERGLRWAIEQHLAHYHRERNHQGLENKILEPGPELGVGAGEGPILRRSRMGGLLNYYYRRAA